MRTLILGGEGMLGRALVREAGLRDLPVLALGHRQADITVRSAVEGPLRRFAPDVVINCAAFTKVDACEEQERQAMVINGEAMANVVAAAEDTGVPLVHVSTDYVFDGSHRAPYEESAPTAPQSVYGKSKLLGEEHVRRFSLGLVVRTSWLFGPHGPNFVATMVRLAQQGQRRFKVVDDQLGCPTYTRYLAAALLDLAPLKLTGLLHYRNREPVTWYDFARRIFRLWQPEVEVEAISTADFERSASRRMAPRPAYSVLAVERVEAALGRQVEAWNTGLEGYLELLRYGRG